MSDISKFNLNGSDINVKDTTARGNIGDLTSLTTTDKTSLVGAINEVDAKQSMTVSYDSTTETLTFS